MLLLPVVGSGARPRYGGVLRVEVEGALVAVDPSVEADAEDIWRRAVVLSHVFETLVTIGPDGLQPALATSWVREANGTRWRFALRAGVRLHDGALLGAAQAAAALSGSIADVMISSDDNTVTIETRGDRPDLLWELADLRSAIAVRGPDGRLHGTGPFRVDGVEGNVLTLAAHNGHWRGRPFLDGVRIEFGRPRSTQLTSLETDRADLVAVQAIDARRVSQRQLRVNASRPIELVALVFEPHRAAPLELPLRRALAAAMDRDAVVRVLLQGHAAPATALLPTWLSGYPSSNVAEDPIAASRGVIAGLPAARRTLVLRVAAGDAVARAIAERVAVDARDAGFLMTVQVPTGLAPRADLRLVRVPLAVTTPGRSLAALMETFGSRTLVTVTREPPPAPGASVEAVARVERALLGSLVIVPIVHVPMLVAGGERVEIFEGSLVRPTGEWQLADVWLQPDGTARP